jgi:hypothetical protein
VARGGGLGRPAGRTRAGRALADRPWPLAPRSGPALAALAGWTALSITWARLRFIAADDSGRLLMYATAFASAMIVMRVPGVRRVTPWALLVTAAAAGFYGLGTRLVPGVFEAEIFGNAGARLAHPITYWNGMGLFSGAGALLAVACASEHNARRAMRSAACALGVVCGFACYMTLSRGAFAAVLCGLVVLLLMRPRRTALRAALFVFVPAVALSVLTLAFSAVREPPRDNASDQISQGRWMAAAVLLAAALAALAAARLLPAPADRDRRVLDPPRAGRLAAAAVVLTLVALVAVSYASEQSDDIATSTARLREATTFRAPYWDVSLGAFADHPLTGVGSGSFRVEWRREAEAARGAFDAHSLYFETLAELGLVGGLLLACFIAAVAAGAVAAARARPDDPVLPAAIAVLAAFAVHAGVDWDWELPAVTLPALLLAAAAITRPEPGMRLPRPGLRAGCAPGRRASGAP